MGFPKNLPVIDSLVRSQGAFCQVASQQSKVLLYFCNTIIPDRPKTAWQQSVLLFAA